MVFDVPAESGGALTILQDFYNEVVQSDQLEIEWIFVVSVPNLQNRENIKVLQFPWIKKSWFHRLFFDNRIAPNLIDKYRIDKVLSLQNMIIPRSKSEQIVYVHQALPFADYKFSITENKLFWVYQNIIGRGIIRSIKQANQVIVQTEWMKEACVKRADVNENKIKVIPPKLNIEDIHHFEPDLQSLSTFFYPANSMEYKNHSIIVKASKVVKQFSLDFNVVFTVKGDENSTVSELKRQSVENQLPIEFKGPLQRSDVYKYYSKSIVLFPSYIEAFGLPLVEAKQHGSIIFAANCPYAREVLEGYHNAYFFDPFTVDELVVLMKNVLEGKIGYKTVDSTIERHSEHTSIVKLLAK